MLGLTELRVRELAVGLFRARSCLSSALLFEDRAAVHPAVQTMLLLAVGVYWFSVEAVLTMMIFSPFFKPYLVLI